jgi:Na+-translocating ferredoxin:NAD+ oxidoreductase RnfG subunit/ferredoxin
MRRRLGSALLLAAGLSLVAGQLAAQGIGRVPQTLLEEVMPGADRFDPAEGDPPVKRAYRGDELIGYVFLTSDLPPQVSGYSGPVGAVVGMTLDGVLTGVRVTDYSESRRYDWGDFLSDPWLLRQFTGKHVGERFRVNEDIDGIAQVTISVRALARGVRDAARRVAIAYAAGAPAAAVAVSEADLVAMSWFEMRERGVAVMLAVNQAGRAPLSLSLVHVPNEEFGRYMVGRLYQNVVDALARRGGADQVVLYVVDGSAFMPPLRTGWSFEQGGRSVAIPSEDVVSIGTPGGGLLLDESSQVGAILLDHEDVDVTAPLTIAFDRGRPELGTFRVEYTSQAALARMAQAAATATAAVPERAGVESPAPSVDRPSAAAPTATAPTPEVAPELPPEQLVQFDLSEVGEDDAYGDLVGSVSWLRLSSTLLVLLLATLAFFTKSPPLRWVSLATTVVVLGWIDGGFLSVSHVTGLIWVGPSAITSDLSLLIMVAFTLVTVLLWGRVFCGYLCPFGALQDFIDRLVPARFKRELPKGLHRTALKGKYVILAVILLPAIAGSRASLYQYFEPFGTVFFIGRNPLLWAIAGAILIAAAVVPRFYCRYACPLGASLAIASMVSLRRIPRVEQCDFCKVCEHHCPTGAIDGPAIDFKECVRCNECETRLARKSGVCRHDMEEFRPRLTQIRRGHPVGAGGP